MGVDIDVSDVDIDQCESSATAQVTATLVSTHYCTWNACGTLLSSFLGNARILSSLTVGSWDSLQGTKRMSCEPFGHGRMGSNVFGKADNV